MDLYKLVVAMKLTKGGGGGDVSVDPLTVNANGVYSASSGHAFDPVTVSVPSSGITPTGTKNIEANGDYDVASFASAHVAVPSAFMSAISITENGTYVPSGSVSGFNQVTVSVSGGGGGGDLTFDEVAMHTFSGTVMGNASAISEYAFRGWNMVGANFPSATSIDSYAFQYCSNLTTADFPAVTSIGSYAFANCSKLTTVSFPNVTSIGVFAFQNCSSLASVNFPNISFISNGVFSNCSGLTEATFLKLSSISGSTAFQNCRQLMSLYLLSTSVVKLYNNAAFFNTPMQKSSYTGSFGSIYVPASLVDSYKDSSATNQWAIYSDRITSYVE